MSETIQIQADWEQTDSTQIDFIKNKPNLYEEWWGTQAEYDAILVKDPDKIYNIKTVYYAVSISAGSNGSVTVNGVTGNYTATVPSGTTLTIEGTADSNYQFDEWSDGNTDNPRIITVNSDITLSAAFEAISNYFYVEDISGSDNTLSITKSSSSAPTVEVFKSTDGTNWTSMGQTDTTPITATIPANSKLYLKATANTWANGDTKYNHITATGNNNVGGNIMSLLNGDNFENTTITTGNTFYYLFNGDTKLVSAGNLTLPSNVKDDCYSHMFYGCTSLTTAPTLPALNAPRWCYANMFYRCTSLTTAPALPATTIGDNAYNSMFYGCTSLTTAPVLNATTIADACYKNMFQGCTGLTIVQSLPATTLANNCYRGMFIGCTGLTTLPTDLLPATTLADYCYYSMFQDCTNITNAPVLPATTLTQYCYRTMFERCTHLNTVTTYAQDISATNCLQLWLNSVAATGDFYNEGGATYTSGASGIPTGWTEHTSL